VRAQKGKAPSPSHLCPIGRKRVKTRGKKEGELVKYYKAFGAAAAVGLLLFLGFGCGGGGDSISDEEEEYIRGQIAPLEEDISSLNGQIASLREDITSLGEEIAELRVKVEGLTSPEEMISEEGEITSVQEDMASWGDEISFPPGYEAMPVSEGMEMAPVNVIFQTAVKGLLEEPQIGPEAVNRVFSSPRVEMEETSALATLALIRAISTGDLISFMLMSVV
jgi:hypothetical protein